MGGVAPSLCYYSTIPCVEPLNSPIFTTTTPDISTTFWSPNLCPCDSRFKINEDGFTPAFSSTSQSAPHINTADWIASQPECCWTCFKPIRFTVQYAYGITSGHNQLFTVCVRQAQGSLAIWQFHALHSPSEAQVPSALQGSSTDNQADAVDSHDMASHDFNAHDSLVAQWRQ